MKLRFFVNTWIFGNYPIEKVLDRVAAVGFDGIELVGEPEQFPPDKVAPMLKDRGLTVTSICGMHPGPVPGDLRYLGHSNLKERQKGMDYVKSCVDMAVAVGALGVLVVPGQVGNPSYYSESKNEDWKRCVESLQLAGKYAEANNIYLTIEPINRYEVGLVNSINDAMKMAHEVDNPYVRIMGDTFHMQMEESEGIPNAIRTAGGEWLRHMHVADNTREAPGLGTMPWREILLALHAINFQGGVSFEPLPSGASPYDARDGLIPADVLDRSLASGLAFLRMLDGLVSED